jgi:hypothetical protein
VLLTLLLAGLLWLYWPRPGPGPVVLLGRGSVGTARWAVLGQRASGGACLQVRVDGARRRLMCDRHWDAPGGVNVWHGELPAHPVARFGSPSLLRVTFPGSDRVLVVSVLAEEITRLSLAGPPGEPSTPLPVHLLLGSKNPYVLAVVPQARAGRPSAFDDDGRPVFYRFMDE